jgi:hypothetical protein
VKWPWGTKITIEQRKETAKFLLGICQVVVLAIIAGPFVPGLVKQPSVWNNIYGAIGSMILYLIAMRLLKEEK